MNGETELVSYIQRLLGYCLTGSIREQMFCVFHGSGANGKSTMLETFGAMMGSYWVHSAMSTFTESRTGDDDRPQPGVVNLLGARFTTASESGGKARFNEERLKELTGGDSVTARQLHSNPITFKPKAKIVIRLNHLPRISGQDMGIWRRIHTVPFLVSFQGPAKDNELDKKLMGELPGILSWTLRGCLDWQRQGLSAPRQVFDAVEDYRQEMDKLGGFVDSECILHAEASCTNAELFQAYEKWCKLNAVDPMTQTGFGLKMKERPGIAKAKKGVMRYTGITLKSVAASALFELPKETEPQPDLITDTEDYDPLTDR